jgi:hypothetical protein
LEAIQTRVRKEQLTVYAFVIMPNHFHAIWQLHDGVDRAVFQRDFLKFTARSILKFMKMNNDAILNKLSVDDADRKFQVWERNSLSLDIYSENFFFQKLKYIHNNPIQEKWRLAELPEDYYYSSAKFYLTGINDFEFLMHFNS